MTSKDEHLLRMIITASENKQDDWYLGESKNDGKHLKVESHDVMQRRRTIPATCMNSEELRQFI